MRLLTGFAIFTKGVGAASCSSTPTRVANTVSSHKLDTKLGNGAQSTQGLLALFASLVPNF